MCYPLAIMAVAAAASAATTIYSAKTQADRLDEQSKYMNQTALSVEQQGASAAAQEKDKARRIAASQTAAFAAGGVDPLTGTPLQLTTETARYGELNALRIQNNAQRSAWGYKTEASFLEQQAGDTMAGGYMKAGSTLLGAASNAYFGSKFPSMDSGYKPSYNMD